MWCRVASAPPCDCTGLVCVGSLSPRFSGIWPAFADGTDINSVARTGNRKAIATADDFGRVKVFRYPCVEKGSMSLQFKGPCLCCRGFA